MYTPSVCKMKFSLLSLVVTAIIVTQKASATVSPQITVNYIVDYSDDHCSTAPNPPQAVVIIRAGSDALTIMEEAANDNLQLRFTATYLGTKLGYSIDAINGTFTDSKKGCYWLDYIKGPTGSEFRLPFGVSNYVWPDNGYSLIWRYTRGETHEQSLTNDFKPATEKETVEYLGREGTTTIKVGYEIGYLDQDTCGPGLVAPPKVDVEIPIQGTAQQVLEKSVDYGPEYRFTATYFNKTLGYYIDAINGTSKNLATNCFWLFYIRFPNNNETLPVGVSNYAIPADGYAVIMRYQISGHAVPKPEKLTNVETKQQMLVSKLLSSQP